MAGNWFKFYRDIFKNPIVTKSHDMFFFWCWLLGNVCYEKKRVFFGGKDVELKPGQLFTTIPQMQAECDLSTMQVRGFLNLLKNNKQINTQISNKGQVITILNWQQYQEKQQTKQQTNNRQTTDKQQTNNIPTNIKEVKEGEEGKKENIAKSSPDDDVFSQAVELFQKNVALVTKSETVERIDCLLNDYGFQKFKYAVSEAKRNHARSIEYVEAICRRISNKKPSTEDNIRKVEKEIAEGKYSF